MSAMEIVTIGHPVLRQEARRRAIIIAWAGLSRAVTPSQFQLIFSHLDHVQRLVKPPCRPIATPVHVCI